MCHADGNYFDLLRTYDLFMERSDTWYKKAGNISSKY